jgi:hypothetical protein
MEVASGVDISSICADPTTLASSISCEFYQETISALVEEQEKTVGALKHAKNSFETEISSLKHNQERILS